MAHGTSWAVRTALFTFNISDWTATSSYLEITMAMARQTSQYSVTETGSYCKAAMPLLTSGTLELQEIYLQPQITMATAELTCPSSEGQPVYGITNEVRTYSRLRNRMG